MMESEQGGQKESSSQGPSLLSNYSTPSEAFYVEGTGTICKMAQGKEGSS